MNFFYLMFITPVMFEDTLFCIFEYVKKIIVYPI